MASPDLLGTGKGYVHWVALDLLGELLESLPKAISKSQFESQIVNWYWSQVPKSEAWIDRHQSDYETMASSEQRLYRSDFQKSNLSIEHNVRPEGWFFYGTSIKFNATYVDSARHNKWRPRDDILRWFDKSALKNSGYLPMFLDYSSRDDNLRVTILVERVVPATKPKFLYHVTPHRRLDSVLRGGLKPKINPDYGYYTPRVFLFTKFPKGDMMKATPHTGASDVSVVKVDTSKFKRFNVYSDTTDKSPYAVWTPSHIPATALSLVSE